MILHYSFHAQRGTDKDVQCETLAIIEVLKEETKWTFDQKDLFFHCEGRFSLLFDSIAEQATCLQLFNLVLSI